MNDSKIPTNESELNELSRKELRNLCKKYGVSQNGNMDELRKRLRVRMRISKSSSRK